MVGNIVKSLDKIHKKTAFTCPLLQTTVSKSPVVNLLGFWFRNPAEDGQGCELIGEMAHKINEYLFLSLLYIRRRMMQFASQLTISLGKRVDYCYVICTWIFSNMTGCVMLHIIPLVT